MTRKTLSALALASLSAPFIRSVAFAQEAAEATSRRTEFVAVDGAQVDQVPGGPLLVYAYIGAFIMILFYMWRLHAKHQKLARDAQALQARLEADERDAD